jgi:hypothetical protein
MLLHNLILYAETNMDNQGLFETQNTAKMADKWCGYVAMRAEVIERLPDPTGGDEGLKTSCR